MTMRVSKYTGSCTINFGGGAEHLAAIEIEARKLNVSRSAVLRWLVETYLPEPPAEEVKKVMETRTFYNPTTQRRDRPWTTEQRAVWISEAMSKGIVRPFKIRDWILKNKAGSRGLTLRDVINTLEIRTEHFEHVGPGVWRAR